MPFRTSIGCVALLCASWTLPASAQDFECHSSPQFSVGVIEQSDDIGAIFAVKARRTGAVPDCPTGEQDADFVVGAPGEPLWFADLVQSYLVMTRSTGPQGDVVVFNLERRDYVLDVPADEMEVDQTGLVYWERVEQGTPQNCPDFADYEKDGLGAVITAETRFDFATGKVSPTGQRRCDATQ